MKPEPINYNNPLGISKTEWIKVLAVNFGLLIFVYIIATICTLSGSDFFLLNFHNESLDRIDNMLRSANIFALFQILFASVEETIIVAYVRKRKPSIVSFVAYYGLYVLVDLVFMFTNTRFPSFLTLVLGIGYAVFWIVFDCVRAKAKRKTVLFYLLRLVIAIDVSFIINEMIALFRIKTYELFYVNISGSADFALNVEYDLAMGIAFLLLTLIASHIKEGGKAVCQKSRPVGGCSPTTMKSSPKNSPNPKKNLSNLPPKVKKRLRWLKAKVILIQTTALLVIAALPWFAGRPVEFALVYASFCLTRLCLGFNRSLHFKSEMSCITIGALCFWGLTFLSPSAEVSIIMSLVYGCALALGFRLYWELHDLLVYKRASKNDRYAMLFVVFKANTDPKHVRGVMLAKGYSDEDEIRIIQLYMQKEKIDYIATYMNFAPITIDKKLTEIANDLYSRR